MVAQEPTPTPGPSPSAEYDENGVPYLAKIDKRLEYQNTAVFWIVGILLIRMALDRV